MRVFSGNARYSINVETYGAYDEPWRQGFLRPDPYNSLGITCQCEETRSGWDRHRCSIHGPTGGPSYKELKFYAGLRR